MITHFESRPGFKASPSLKSSLTPGSKSNALLKDVYESFALVVFIPPGPRFDVLIYVPCFFLRAEI